MCVCVSFWFSCHFLVFYVCLISAMSIDASVSTELKRLEVAPASPTERAQAQRALVRYEKPGGGDGDSQGACSS